LSFFGRHEDPPLVGRESEPTGRSRQRGRDKKRQHHTTSSGVDDGAGVTTTARPHRNPNRKVTERAQRPLPRPGPSLVTSRDRKK